MEAVESCAQVGAHSGPSVVEDSAPGMVVAHTGLKRPVDSVSAGTEERRLKRAAYSSRVESTADQADPVLDSGRTEPVLNGEETVS